MTRTTMTIAILVALAGTARAWEAETTHAGLTEQAALASGVHAALVKAQGREQGWFEPLTVPPALAPTLYLKLHRLAPTGGVVPDARGRQPAIAWLVAGAVLEDIPAERGRNHFYDPLHRSGLSGRAAGVGTRLVAALARKSAGGRGRAAPDWIAAKDNDLGMERFLLELEASAVAKTRDERDLHLAFALLCAGAMTHVLEDVGSPSRARDDYAEHLAELGAGAEDRGSRFERLAALAYGRLGVRIDAPVARPAWRDYFTASDGKGLADLTASRWYSSGTLPGDVNVAGLTPAAAAEATARHQRFPAPRPATLQLEAARAPDGARLNAEDGTCLAHYRREGEILSFFIPDGCAGEQIAKILPEVGAYAAGFLAWLFRGQLVVDAASGVSAGDVALGKGVLRILAENAAGERTALGGAVAVESAQPGVPIVMPAIPAGAARIVAVFRGVDAHGQEIVAIGSLRP